MRPWLHTRLRQARQALAFIHALVRQQNAIQRCARCSFLAWKQQVYRACLATNQGAKSMEKNLQIQFNEQCAA